ncbi:MULTISPECIES: hypothetical protein [Bradyrhizobium]
MRQRLDSIGPWRIADSASRRSARVNRFREIAVGIGFERTRRPQNNYAKDSLSTAMAAGESVLAVSTLLKTTIINNIGRDIESPDAGPRVTNIRTKNMTTIRRPRQHYPEVKTIVTRVHVPVHLT